MTLTHTHKRTHTRARAPTKKDVRAMREALLARDVGLSNFHESGMSSQVTRRACGTCCALWAVPTRDEGANERMGGAGDVATVGGPI